ncbi:unnamed protein product [Cunninghamella blakesleeana]
MDTNGPEFQTSKKAVKALKTRVEVINKHLEPLLSKDISAVYGYLPLNEKCQLDTLLSFTISSLYYIYMKTQGQDPQSHELIKELRRVQGYVKKIKEAEGKGPRRTMTVNREAAGRMIKAGLPSNRTNVVENKRKVIDLTSDASDSSDSEEEKEKDKKGKDNEVDIKGDAKSKKKARYDPFS